MNVDGQIGAAQPDRRKRRPYWLLVVFAGLMLSPPAWAAAAMIAFATGATIAGAVSDAAARRAQAAEVARSGDGTALGVEREGRIARLGDRQLAAHGLILGASGSGKSTTLLTVLTDNIRRGRPVVAVDMKGSPAFARELAAAAAAAGRPFRLWTPDGPSRWNPLAHGNATELKDKLIATERFTEPHYQRAAERYVQTVLQALHALHPQRAATLDEVVRAMDPRWFSGMVRGLPREHGERVQDYLSGLTPDQLSAVRGLGTRLAIISESHTGKFLSPQAGPATGAGIDLRRALEGDEVVLFSLNSSTYGKLSAQLGALVIQDLVAAAGHRIARGDAGARDAGARDAGARDTLGPQAIIGIDEFSGLGADNIIALMSRCREAGMGVILATQELADLDRAGPGLRDQVVGNTAVKLIHRQEVPASAFAVAQMAGTVKRWRETQQIGGGLLGSYDTRRGTRQEVEEFLVHPNEVKTLRTGEAVVIAKTPHASVRTIQVTPPQRTDSTAAPLDWPATAGWRAPVAGAESANVSARAQQAPRGQRPGCAGSHSHGTRPRNIIPRDGPGSAR